MAHIEIDFIGDNALQRTLMGAPPPELGDCPHPVGTPEHSEWVRTVYIPAQRWVGRGQKDRERYGAESQGRRLIIGQLDRDPDVWPGRFGAATDAFRAIAETVETTRIELDEHVRRVREIVQSRQA